MQSLSKYLVSHVLAIMACLKTMGFHPFMKSIILIFSCQSALLDWIRNIFHCLCIISCSRSWMVFIVYLSLFLWFCYSYSVTVIQSRSFHYFHHHLLHLLLPHLLSSCLLLIISFFLSLIVVEATETISFYFSWSFVYESSHKTCVCCCDALFLLYSLSVSPSQVYFITWFLVLFSSCLSRSRLDGRKQVQRKRSLESQSWDEIDIEFLLDIFWTWNALQEENRVLFPWFLSQISQKFSPFPLFSFFSLLSKIDFILCRCNWCHSYTCC